ncbi:MAG TPA: hypothetical protein VHC97_06395 [Thermoanaerobaculia bacterium]|nr:hypothetical protein [Thermoanaerobaculia bacterium]
MKIATTKPVMTHLQRLVSTGLFGKSPAEAAEQLIRERIRDIYPNAIFQDSAP